jgi:hypothetical protein
VSLDSPEGGDVNGSHRRALQHFATGGVTLLFFDTIDI